MLKKSFDFLESRATFIGFILVYIRNDEERNEVKKTIATIIYMMLMTIFLKVLNPLKF